MTWKAFNILKAAVPQENETLARRPYDYNKLAVALREASLEALLEVLPLICRVLREQNPRFNEGMFMEWALEGK